jgi:UDP-N-acetylglucosamine diphosphorylase/glucosamine-1-phosphate N-acetyltransferase
MRVIIYDDGLGKLAPLTDLRPAFEVRTGALTTLRRIEEMLPGDAEIASLYVRDEIKPLYDDACDFPINSFPEGIDSVLLINGRCPLPPNDIASTKPGTIVVERLNENDHEAAVVYAFVKPDVAKKILTGDVPTEGVTYTDQQMLMRRPWDVRRFRDAAMNHDLDHLAQIPGTAIPDNVHHRGSHPVIIRSGADIWPGVTFDSSQGLIVIAAGATIRPGAIIAGPVFVGEDSTVMDRAHIKAHTAIGPRCKVGGEVGGTIFQGLANKAHEGHFGDSWVGEWVNFGAGTSNSNLLNTYAEVISKATVRGSNERTGQTFLGAIVGDHVKFAISSRIMTGAVIHMGAMLASTAPVVGCIGRFTWGTDTGTTAFRLPRFLDTAKAVMSRRGIEPSEAYLERIKELHSEASEASSS